MFPAFPADKNLCPKEALLEYVSKTKAYRGSGSNRKTKLFLSYIKPQNPVSSSSIARRILAMLSLDDTDTEKFKAHSTRSTSVLAAASAGIKQPIGGLNLFVNSSITSLPVQMLLECQCCQLLPQVYCKYHVDIWTFQNVIIWMAQITEWSPAILDYTKDSIPPIPNPWYGLVSRAVS